jgi:hypothetical protein
MSRYLSFTSVLLLLILVSCQKENSFELGKPSKGSLQSSSGDCLPKVVGGTFKAGQSLADSNYIEVTVDVAQTGKYTIFTDTVNGYSFKASGNFNKVGANTVRLKGFGTPGGAGTDDFAVVYDSSLCFISVPVIAGGSSGGTAVYSLQGTGGDCMTSNVAGTYTSGTALTSANKIDIQVNVTTVGSWNITTTTVAGFKFSGSGNFTNTGVQSITLTASGTPSASGAQVFPVTVGSSSCSFAITVTGGTTNPPPPNTGDYFPRTVNSHWTYMWDKDPTDTMRFYVIPQTKVVSGNTFNIFLADDGSSVDTLGYFRKSGSDYFQWGDVGFELDFDNPLYAEVTMLKDNQAANFSWTSSSFSGTISGQAFVARKKYTITQKNATTTSNGVQYPNTIVVKVEYQVQAGPTWISIPNYQLFYYTKNYGITKMESFDATGTLDETLELVSYKIF